MQIKTFISNNKNYYLYIFLITLILIIFKWVYSFLIFSQEDLSLKTINESVSDGYYYFPLIKYLALIDFNISFDKNIENLRYIPLPLGGIIFHSFLLKVFDNFFISIFIIELLSLYLYLTIFFFDI